MKNGSAEVMIIMHVNKFQSYRTTVVREKKSYRTTVWVEATKTHHTAKFSMHEQTDKTLNLWIEH